MEALFARLAGWMACIGMAFLRLHAEQQPPPPPTPSWVWFEAESGGGETSDELSQMLLQVASEELPYGWTTSVSTGRRTLTHRGALPLMVRNLAGTVRLKRGDAASLTVTPLDFNGYRTPADAGNGSEVRLLAGTPYYLLERGR